MKHKPPLKGYVRRNKILREIGFDSYQEYLKSDLWMKIRDRIFQEKGRICYLCGQPAILIHHNTYSKDVLVGKDLHSLKPVCHSCHQSIEVENNEKRSLRATRRLFYRLRQKEISRIQAPILEKRHIRLVKMKRMKPENFLKKYGYLP